MEGLLFSKQGGKVTSWSYQGHEIIYPFRLIEREGKMDQRGGIFACFPNFGRAPQFGLPIHGPLRDLEGTLEVEGERAKAVFPSVEINDVRAVVEVRVGPIPEGLEYTLAVAPRSGSMWVNPGFHPYFVTPQGKISITTPEGAVYQYDEPIPDSVFIPFLPKLIVTIPGLGSIEISTKMPDIFHAHACFVLWTDSKEYFCVEPVAGRPELYGTEECPRLTEPFEIKMGIRVVELGK